MATSKEQIHQEEEHVRVRNELDVDPSKCSICLFPLPKFSNSNKCKQCLEKIEAIPTGFQFEVAGTERKEFECPICLCIIRNATELPCEHLMCKDCLEHYEKGQIDKSEREGREKAEFSCSVCMTPYQVKEKTPVRSTDRMIQTTLPIKCLQKNCVWTGCIMDYEEHQNRHCNFVVIRCPYYDLGCLTQMERAKLPVHNQAKRPIHDSLLLTAVSAFTIERKGFKLKMDEQNRKIESLQGLYETTIKRCENLEKDNLQLKQRVQRQDEAIRDIKSSLFEMQGNVDSSSDLDSLKKDLGNQSKEVKNLKTFAEQTSRLHKTFSHPDIQDVFTYLLPDQYEANNEIKQWKLLTEEVTAKPIDQDCEYLKTLKDSIVRYQGTIYPAKWKTRLTKWRKYIDYGVNVCCYVKLFLYKNSRKFSLKVFKTTDEFDRTVAKSNKWCKHSNDTASYFDWKQLILYVAIFAKDFEDAYIVNWEDVNDTKSVATDGRIVPVEEAFVSNGYIIFSIL
ncbi:uncharacterized protein [Clytia hemisphaerica]|uniref:RING-type domain-containing protein n=1 Tax=Clytia hemisphaerica TaxID=252671 RepID=A0A7M5XHS4_9CNID